MMTNPSDERIPVSYIEIIESKKQSIPKEKWAEVFPDYTDYVPKLYKAMQLPSYVHGYSLAIEYMRDWFLKKFPKNYFNSVYINGYGKIKVLKQSDETDNYITYLNSDDIKMPLYVRNRIIGDKMVIKNMDNEKKVKNIFIDSKVPIDKRDNYPIVVDSNDIIVWLPGLKKSKFDRKKSGKYDIILKYEK